MHKPSGFTAAVCDSPWSLSCPLVSAACCIPNLVCAHIIENINRDIASILWVTKYIDRNSTRLSRQQVVPSCAHCSLLIPNHCFCWTVLCGSPSAMPWHSGPSGTPEAFVAVSTSQKLLVANRVSPELRPAQQVPGRRAVVGGHDCTPPSSIRSLSAAGC